MDYVEVLRLGSMILLEPEKVTKMQTCWLMWSFFLCNSFPATWLCSQHALGEIMVVPTLVEVILDCIHFGKFCFLTFSILLARVPLLLSFWLAFGALNVFIILLVKLERKHT